MSLSQDLKSKKFGPNQFFTYLPRILETIMFEQQESMKNEETKAMIHARAQAQVERENHEYRMEQAKMEAKERSKVEKEVARVRTEELYKFVTTVLQNKDGMLSNGLFFAGGLTVVGITTWQVMKFGFRYAESMLSKPKLGNNF